MCRHAVPAIWLYPESECDVDVVLRFQGSGFMTVSTPPYQDRWRIHVNPSIPFAKYKERYGFQSHFEFLDYDGLREGPYQQTRGWCIPQRDFISWQETTLRQLGFTDNEVGSATYYYGRMLMDNRYPGKYVLIWPQDKSIVDKSVELTVYPKPRTVYRVWFYLDFADAELTSNPPELSPVIRQGFTVTELGFLTKRDVPSLNLSASGHSLIHGLLPHWVMKARY
jgi:hypothetical protein